MLDYWTIWFYQFQTDTSLFSTNRDKSKRTSFIILFFWSILRYRWLWGLYKNGQMSENGCIDPTSLGNTAGDETDPEDDTMIISGSKGGAGGGCSLIIVWLMDLSSTELEL